MIKIIKNSATRQASLREGAKFVYSNIYVGYYVFVELSIRERTAGFLSKIFAIQKFKINEPNRHTLKTTLVKLDDMHL